MECQASIKYWAGPIPYGIVMSTTPATDGKEIANALCHRAVVSGLAIRYAQLGKMIVKGPAPKLDWSTPRDIGMVVLDATLALVTWNYLVKQGMLPPDIVKN